MQILVIVLIILAVELVVGSIIIWLLLLSVFFAAKTKTPWVKTPKKNYSQIVAAMNLPANSLIYDLGCGDAGFLFTAEKMGYRCIGYELSFYPYWRAMIKKVFSGSSVLIRRKNFFGANITDADGVFLFLTDKVLPNIEQEILTKLKSGTIIASYCIKLSQQKLIQIVDTKPSKTYIYRT